MEVFRLIIVKMFVFYLMAACASVSFALPSNAVFMGLENDKWQLFVTTSDSTLTKIKLDNISGDISFPKYYPMQKKLLFIDTEARVVFYDLNDQSSQRFASETGAYSDAVFDGESTIYMVWLEGKKSKNTDIYSIDVNTGKIGVATSQRSQQFDPVISSPDKKLLLYMNVTCVDDCSQIIGELWVRNLLSKETKQITLNNSISRQPVQNESGEIFYSSNKNGGYHIWQYREESADTPLTEGHVTDSFPATQDDWVYFIRRSKDFHGLMRVKTKGQNKPEAVLLPSSIEQVRELFISGQPRQDNGI